MDLTMPLEVLLEVLLICALIAVNGFFSGSEIAIISLRRSRLDALIEQGQHAAGKVRALVADPDRFFAIIQIGVTCAGVLASTLAGAMAVEYLAPLLRQVPLPMVSERASELALTGVAGTVAYASLVLGELVPKSVAHRFSERWALIAVFPLTLMARISGPLVRLLTGTSNLLLKPFHDRTDFSETRLSIEELQALVEDSTRHGVIAAGHGQMLHKAIEFPDLRVRDIAVPYTEMLKLDLDDSPERVRELLRGRSHARMPVTRGGRDNVVGIVSSRDIMHQLLEGQELNLEPLLLAPYFVPASSRVEPLLRELQARHQHLAIVVDELGGVKGLVTIEDIVEELVGEIYDEQASSPPWTQVDEHTWQVPGSMSISDLSALLSESFGPSPHFSTVAGLMIDSMEHIPEVGERVVCNGYSFTATERGERRVKRVQVRRLGDGDHS